MKTSKRYLSFILLLFFPLLVFQQVNSNIVQDFLSSLDKTQRKKAVVSFTDNARERWHFLPATMWQREGIQLGELTTIQKNYFSKLLKTYLSKTGYDKTMRIIELENILVEMGGSDYTRDTKKYHITIYGNAEKDKIWAWSFEGHHLSLNFTIVNNKVSMTPRFMGANPATINAGKRKGERTLKREEDLGLELINSLSKDQLQKVLFQKRGFDIITGNDSKVDPLPLIGISMKELNSDQQTILLDLINEYLASMPSELALKRRNSLKKEEFNEIRFAWSGDTIKGKPHYYRIQGKTFLIEFDNVQNNANHIHTVWRDFDGDFGRDLIKEHYQQYDH